MKKLLFLLAMVVTAMMAVPQKVMAKTVTIYFTKPSNWGTPKVWIYDSQSGSNDIFGNSWSGNKVCTETTTSGLYQWTGDVRDIESSYVIFTDGINQYPAKDADGLLVLDGASYNTTSGLDCTDTEFEMVAACNGETQFFPLTAMRYRNKPDTDTNKGKLSATHFAVGFKDEQLPGNVGDEVKIYVRGKNNPYAVFRPSTSSLGSSYSLMDNTNLTDLRCEAYLAGSSAVNSENTITIKKGTGVSYTVGLNLGGALSETGREGVIYPIAYTIKANSLSLYTNKSLDDFFSSNFITKGTYKNSGTLTKKNDLEDYYIFGTIYGDSNYDEYKGGYMFSEATDNNVNKWTRQDNNGKTVSDYFKMEKQLFLNPNDKNHVDSIVYSKVISKPTKVDGDNVTEYNYENMYMLFAPKSLIDGNANGAKFGYSDGAYSVNDKWNYVVRPEVFDQKDGTAITGATLISGVNNEVKRNGEQSLNPIVDNTKKYYIIRLNTTTSTYRVEFVNSDDITINEYGIRTFCSRFNYQIPEGFAAYSAQSFEASTNTSLNGQPNGQVKLRRLKFIPANEPVVLVYNKNFSHPFSGNESVTQEFTVITDGAGDPNHYLELENNEDWWYLNTTEKATYTDSYNNLLVACLDGETIPNGKYHKVGNMFHYDYRNFALNTYQNTAYWHNVDKDDSKNYIGFFRMAGKVKAGNAYLRLTDTDMDYDGQLLGDVKDGMDDTSGLDAQAAPAKFTFAFDVEPWADVTAIKEVVDNNRQDDDAYYTLEGVRVAKPMKGLYIHHGKKVIFK